MKIALFGGSFDPVHNGHLAVANFIATQTATDEVWFLLSPQNPLKTTQKLTTDEQRLQMLRLAISNNPKFRICDTELSLPKPNYTIDTLTALSQQHPNDEFSLIIGEDNLVIFPQWKAHEKIIENHKIYVYPRSGAHATLTHRNIEHIAAPMFDVSSSQIRERLQHQQPIDEFVPHSVAEYIVQTNLYQ